MSTEIQGNEISRLERNQGSYMPDLRQVTEFRLREVIHCHKVL